MHSHGAMREVTTGEPGPTLRMQQPPVRSRLYGRGEATLCAVRESVSLRSSTRSNQDQVQEEGSHKW